MSKLTDGEIVSNYTPTATSALDTDENLDCLRCGKPLSEQGVDVHLWSRPVDLTKSLPFSIDMCNICDHQVRQLQSNKAQ